MHQVATFLGVSDTPLPRSAHVSVGIAAAPEAVWDVLSDPGVNARFSPELCSAWLEGANSLEVGATIVGENARGERSWTTRSLVRECEPPYRLVWATGDPPAATWSFDLVEVPGGSTLTHAVVLHEGRDPLDAAIRRDPDHAEAIVEKRLDELLAGMTATVEGIARRCEGLEVDALPAS